MDTYNAPKRFVFDNAIVNVYSPILSDAERKRRYEKIKEAAEMLIKSTKEGETHKTHI